MNKGWVIIWKSRSCDDTGVEPGVYHVKSVAENDRNELTRTNVFKTFHVVEYESEEHKNAIM